MIAERRSEYPDQFERPLVIRGETPIKAAELAVRHVMERFGSNRVFFISRSPELRAVYLTYDPDHPHWVRDFTTPDLPDRRRGINVALNRKAVAIVVDETHPEGDDHWQTLATALLTGHPVIACGSGDMTRFERLVAWEVV